MKKVLPLLALILCFNSFSQGITVNTTTYTPDQLINQVLINSPCVAGFGVTTKNGSDFGSTPSIGYFENLNPNFPIARGVVLSTGSVIRTPSPNNVVLSDGNTAWTGDTDMEAVLLSQGLTIRTINASYIEFDFRPKTPLFNFSFVFASEEYGTSQCNFSDSFAFLLKDNAGGAYVNLAVIPSTNIPISVSTIRDNAHNPNCPSANPTYFGAFNGSGFGPAINFNGETIKMTASATGLDVTHTYHIKIVIADGGNNIGYDSAIFLEANSLNIGQDVLGIDYNIANNNAICPGSILPTLVANPPGSSLSPLTTYSWLNGTTPITGQTSSSLNLNNVTPLPSSGINTFSVIYQEPNCVAITDPIDVQIYPQINVVNTIPTIYASCGASPYSFDLASNTPKIIAATSLPAGTIISYHNSNPDAVANINPLSSPFSSSTVTLSGQTLYVRINSPTSPCYVIKSFLLKLVPTPVITAVPPTLSACARNTTDSPSMANFVLTASKNSIVGTQSLVWNVISYHTSQADADANLNPLTITGTNVLLSVSRTLYVRFTNISDPNCYVTTSFNLVIKPLPLIDIITDKIVCSAYALPTLSVPGAVYSTLSGGLGTHPAAGDYITPVAPTNFINTYVSNTLNGCVNQRIFKVTKADLLGITPPSASYCNTYTLPVLPYGKYYTLSGGASIAGNTNLTGANLVRTNTTSATTVTTYYVRFDDFTVTPTCSQELPFTITLIPLTPLPTYTTVFSCNAYSLVPDVNGGAYYTGPNKSGLITLPASIAANQTIYVYKETATTPVNCFSEKPLIINIGIGSLVTPGNVVSCSSYVLPAVTSSGAQYWSGPTGTGTQYSATNVISTPSSTLYYYIPGQTCTNNLPFTITNKLQPMPDILNSSPVCDVYILPAVTTHSGNYWTGTGGTGIIKPVGSPVFSNPPTNQTTIYYVENDPADSSCFVQDSFVVTVYPSPLVDVKPSEVVTCNTTYVLDNLANGEYYQSAGGPSSLNPILPAGYIFPQNTGATTIYVYNFASAPNTCVSEYSINIDMYNTSVTPINDIYACNNYTLLAPQTGAHYYTLSGGPLVVGQIEKMPGTIITTTIPLFLFKENNVRIPCKDEDPFTVTILTTPVVNVITPVVLCDSYTLPAYNSITSTSPVTHYYTLSGGPSVAGQVEKFPGNAITTTITLYAYADVGTLATTVCFDEKPMAITINHTPIITTIPDVYACNNYSLPSYNSIATTLGSVSKYYTLSGGLSTTGNFERAVGFNVTTPGLTTLYAYAETGTIPNCFSDKTLAINILTTPVVTAITPVSACDTYSLPAYNTITSTVPVTHYYTLPGGPTVTGNIERLAGYAVTTPGTNTIYAYAEVGTTATRVCFDEKPLVITINRTPVIPTIPNVYSCDVYSLPAYSTILTTVGSISHYYKMAGGTTTLGNTERFVGNNILTPGLTTLYAYAETGTTPNCRADKELNITILTTPIVNAIAPVSACDTYSLPAYNTITSTVPVNHYYTLSGGSTVVGNIDRPVGYAITTPGLNTVYAYAEVGTPATKICFNEKPKVITINVTPVLAPVVSSSHCATENFTLGSLTVGAYYEDALHTTPLISTAVVATKTIYVYASTGTIPNCTDSDSFIVTIYNTPIFATSDVRDVNVCNQYILPALTTTNAKYYTGPNASGIEIPVGTIFTAATQIIYVHAESGVSPVICPADKSLLINVFNVTEPLTNPNTNVYCGQYTLTPLTNGNYFTGPNGSGISLTAGTSITTSQDIYVFGTAPAPYSCSDNYLFHVQVIYAPNAYPTPLSDRTVCDTDGTNDGLTAFTLTTLTTSLLGPIQSANPNITVQYFATYADATATVGGVINAGVNPITSIVADHALTSIFYSISDNSTTNSCKNINSIGVQIIVNELPKPTETMEPHAICIENPASVPPVVLRNYTIESNLNPMNYSFIWSNSLGLIVGNGSTLTVSLADTYSLIATSNSTGCSSTPFNTVVINSQKPIVTFTVSDAFEDNQIITVIATGIGDYEYQIDGSPFQDSPIFENQNFVLDHQIIVRDKNGCNDTVIISVSAVVVNFPKLFTPNGDGWYDTWKVYGINQLSNAKISIYNRYGKLLAQLDSNSPGWDGTLNNAPVPADDYWFTVSYVENGSSKEFRSHFSITR